MNDDKKLCPDGCGLEKPEISGFEAKHTPLKLVKVPSTNLFKGTSREAKHIELPNGDRIVCPNDSVAEFIVRAVNSHEALLEEVKQSIDKLSIRLDERLTLERTMEIREGLMKAIAQAEGKV